MKLFVHLPARLCHLHGKSLLGFFATMLLSFSLFSQTTVKGTVTDAESNEPLIGVSIIVKGTSKGTVSDLDGNYAVELAQGENTLVFTFVGFRTTEVAVNGQTNLNVSLETAAIGLDEITVTALGISREKKSLGYAIQEIGGDNLDKAKDANLINNLAGKVAGVQVVGNPSGIGGSARVTIRGERSLNINANQPLFVIDGVPISNGFSGNSGRSYQDVDYGNGAGFVNPDDIESVTVLKGGGATALYGSRGANGVILITTKSGKNTKGIGISVNSTVMFENPLVLPEYQNVYGQGLGGQFEFKDGNGGGIADGVDENWGPKFEGQLIKQFDGTTSNGFRGADVGNVFTRIGPVNLSAQLAARGEITPTPWIAQPDNVKDFFETGVLQSHNFAVTGSNEKGDFRLSYTWLDQTGIVPNTDLERNTIAFSGSYKLSDKLTARTVINYLNSESGNRPNLSYGTENIMYLFNCWFGRGININSLRDYWQPGRVGLNQFNFNYNYHDNPYFGVYENTNGQALNRMYGYASLAYQFNDNLSLMVRGATDVNDEFRDRRRAYSTQRFLRGAYREENLEVQETNLDLLLSYDKQLSTDFTLGASVGGNLRKETIKQSDVLAPELAVPGVYALGNSAIALQASAFRSEKRVNSAYGTAQLGFRNFLYLDVAGRNDWSSTLPADNWSYFYYSTSVSAVLSELMQIGANSPLSFLKVRASLAQIGNDTDPFRLFNVYNSQTAVKGQPAYTESSQLANAELKPEISTALEAGVDVRFFNNRVGIDATYYRTRSENQILPQAISITSGYSQRIVNAGLIENSGVELALNLVPVQLSNGLQWDMNFNFSRNRSKVLELFEDPITGQEVTEYVMADRYIQVQARVGQQMGDMYGIGYARVSNNPNDKYYDPTGQYVGQIVFNNAGKPIATSSRIKLGNYNPDFLLGINNTFSFKGLSLNVLFDIRQGGKIYSHTQTVGREGGQIIETLEGRANGYDLSVAGNGVIGEGVVQNGDKSFSPNTVKLSAREWHTSYTLGRGLVEGVIYDASFAKLREVRLAYTIPNKWLGKMPVRDISLSFVGRNLALWSDVPHVDPETASTSGGTIIPGVESVALPSTRSWGFNLNFKF
ncbi:MAG: SusC/RagA family TonB-linked outer membrane protein [Saprospiraceae bacterium]|nr:SusC/RagA family TonB-linked outer membrane protein [Saprospiraceae bacterium]